MYCGFGTDNSFVYILLTERTNKINNNNSKTPTCFVNFARLH